MLLNENKTQMLEHLIQEYQQHELKNNIIQQMKEWPIQIGYKDDGTKISKLNLQKKQQGEIKQQSSAYWCKI